MNKNYQYKPFQFFVIIYILTWTAEFIAAFFSYQPGKELLELLFMVFGLFAPAITTIYMIFSSGSLELKNDFENRLINIRRIRWKYIPWVFLLMPAILIVSILISVLFGHSIHQLNLSSEFNIMNGRSAISLMIVFLAPTVEDLAWRGYGMDSILSKFNMFPATIYFSILWAFWHLPLFFIKGYYHNTLWNTNILYVINFFISVFPLTIIMNWLYYRNKRCILVCIIIHIMAVLFPTILKVDESTKCIETVVMLILSLIIIMKNKDLFFSEKIKFSDHNAINNSLK